MNDKMSAQHVFRQQSSIWKNYKNIKVVKEKTSRTSYGGIDYVWENGYDMQIGNWNKKNLQGTFPLPVLG